MSEFDDSEQFLKNILRVMLSALIVCIIALMVILMQTPLGAIWRQLFDALFGVSSTHMFWYITRASGIVAYLLLWLSTVWGLGVSAKMFDRLLPRTFTYDAHEYLSLLAIVFTVVHIVVLVFDSYTPFSFAQLIVPFASSYRPFWIGLGIIATYLTVLVTVTFYLRKWIGIRAFRAIHILSFAAYFGVTVHSWFSGTDTPLAASQLMYLGTAAVVIVMTAYWYLIQHDNKRSVSTEKQQPILRTFDLNSEQTISQPRYSVQYIQNRNNIEQKH